MTTARPHADDDTIAVLPMVPGGSLTREQSQRVTCLALALGLLRGRSVPIHSVWNVAEWLYLGDKDHDRNPNG